MAGASKREMAEMFQRLFDEERDKLEQTVRDGMDASKVDYVACRGCGKKTPVDVPDWGARRAFLEFAATIAYGKAPTAAAPAPPVELVGDDLEDKSPAELDELERQILASLAGSS